MQTAWRTRDETDRRRPRGRARIRASIDDISPMWEALPEGNAQVGTRHAVLVRDARLRRALACADAVAALVALYVVVHLIDPNRVHMRPTVLLAIPFVLLASKVLGLYDRDQNLMRKT